MAKFKTGSFLLIIGLLIINVQAHLRLFMLPLS